MARAQGYLDLAELIHEWGHTFIKFMAGQKVRTPAMVREQQTIRTSDPKEIRDFFDAAFG